MMRICFVFRKWILKFPYYLLPLSLVLCLIGCLEKNPSSSNQVGRLGTLSLRIRVEAASPFNSIAKSGDITVSGKDMEPIKTSLIIGDSYVEGTVTNIPTGLNRIIELNVYDAYGTIRYQGSATANVLADSVVSVLVTLVRKKGSIAVGGLISEIDTTTIPPTSTPWGPSELFKLGAQGSIFGSVLDLDEGRVWMSAEAKASQSGIDLVFMFYSGFFHLDNAIQAKYAGISNSINLTSSYDNAMIKDIGIVKVMGKPKDQESARKAFLNGTKIDGAPIEVGDMFLVESTGGKLAFVRAGSIVGADNRGSIEVDVSFVTLL